MVDPSKLLDAMSLPEIIATTQASGAKGRSPELGDVGGTRVAEDVLIVNFLAPSNWEDTFETPHTVDDVRIHGWRNLGGVCMLHAEQSCTQHIFRYLMPVNWLPDSNFIMSWYRSGRPRPTPPILKAMKDVLRQIRKSTRFLKRKSLWCVGTQGTSTEKALSYYY